MTKKTIIIPVALLMALLSCCCLAVVFAEGSYLPFKVCRPIGYPEGRRIELTEGEVVIQRTTSSINSIMSFFDGTLSTHESRLMGNDLGRWQKQQTDGTIMYACYGNDINRLTTETGCIYVGETEDGATIDYVRFRSEGGHVPCPNDLPVP